MTFHHRRPDVCLPPIFVRMCHLFLFYVESYLSTTRFSDLLSGAVTNDSLGKSIFLFGLGDNFTSSTVQSVEVMSISQQSRRDLLTNLLECTIKLRRTNGITWGDKLPRICGYKTSGKYKVVVTGHDDEGDNVRDPKLGYQFKVHRNLLLLLQRSTTITMERKCRVS